VWISALCFFDLKKLNNQRNKGLTPLTSVTIIIGFSILVFSKFIPSIYFGLLTGLAMLIALIAALTLLPQLLIFQKPFGPERK